MAWNTEGQNMSEQKTYINCNGNKTDVTGLSGLGLIEKIKSVARDSQISKFDLYDETNRNLSPSDIESGNFTGSINIIRFNAAA
jgi:hypothetical protein